MLAMASTTRSATSLSLTLSVALCPACLAACVPLGGHASSIAGESWSHGRCPASHGACNAGREEDQEALLVRCQWQNCHASCIWQRPPAFSRLSAGTVVAATLLAGPGAREGLDREGSLSASASTRRGVCPCRRSIPSALLYCSRPAPGARRPAVAIHRPNSHQCIEGDAVFVRRLCSNASSRAGRCNATMMMITSGSDLKIINLQNFSVKKDTTP